MIFNSQTKRVVGHTLVSLPCSSALVCNYSWRNDSSSHNQLFAASRSALSIERGSLGVMRWLLLALCACAAAAINCSKVPDHYATLNVTKNATHEEIRIAARKALLLAHPDKVYHAGEKFYEVRRAMEELLKPKRKNAYDRLRVYCQRPWLLRWAKKQQYKWSRWSSRWVHGLPMYVIIIYIGDPAALWGWLATTGPGAWVVANPGMTAGAVAVAVVAVGAACFFFS